MYIVSVNRVLNSKNVSRGSGAHIWHEIFKCIEILVPLCAKQDPSRLLQAESEPK